MGCIDTDVKSKQCQQLAEETLARVLAELPAEVRQAAEECTLLLDGEDGDLLGVFDGVSRLDGSPTGPDDAPRITLFLDTLWDYAEGDPQTFRDEVRITFLHELGHYLGWDEDDVAERGLE